MFIEGRALGPDHRLAGDVCVVGSGAAGLPLALELARHGLHVVLLESGGREPRPRSQALLDVTLSGVDYPIHVSRERYLGGTTNHWGGVCKPFDPFELEAHDWVPHSGWPIARSDLDPYYEKARPLLGLPDPRYAFDPAAEGVASLPPLIDAEEAGIVPQIWRATQPGPTRLRETAAETLASHRRLHCVLETTAAELVPARSGGGIDHLRARTFAGHDVRVEASDFVLCGGAIENARLLLLSDSVVPGGLGNQHGWVGRCFMDHPGRWLGDLVVTGADGRRYREQEVMRREGGAGPGADLMGWITTPALRRERRLFGFMTFGQVLEVDPEADLERAGVRELLAWLAETGGSGDSGPLRVIRLAVNWEQTPNRDSRITLSTERDALGIRKPHLHWAIHPADLRSVAESSALLARAVARSGHGRLRLADPAELPVTIGAGHQMGTTRMSRDPRQGVTTADAAVHGIDNLFVGGSGLFPTGGWQHPTLTIVALSLRLAEHLRARHRARRPAPARPAGS